MPGSATYLAARPFDFYFYCKAVVRLFSFPALKLFLYISHEHTENISKIQ